MFIVAHTHIHTSPVPHSSRRVLILQRRNRFPAHHLAMHRDLAKLAASVSQGIATAPKITDSVKNESLYREPIDPATCSLSRQRSPMSPRYVGAERRKAASRERETFASSCHSTSRRSRCVPSCVVLNKVAKFTAYFPRRVGEAPRRRWTLRRRRGHRRRFDCFLIRVPIPPGPSLRSYSSR